MNEDEERRRGEESCFFSFSFVFSFALLVV